MNTFKQEVAVRRSGGCGRAGRDGCRASGVGQPGRSRPGADLSVLHGRATDGRRRRAYNSLLSVVNSTASAKAVKVRFLEGKNSREVLDFNLYLSAQGRLDRRDHPDRGRRRHLHGGQVLHDAGRVVELAIADAVRQLRLRGLDGDGAGTSLDRTREGYVEIIEMGDVTRLDRPRRGHPRQRRSALHDRADRRRRSADTVRRHRRPVRRHDADQRRCAGEDFGVDADRAATASRTTALWFAAGRRSGRPGATSTRRPRSSPPGHERYVTRLATRPRRNPVDPVSRRADAQQRVQRVRARRGHQVGHRLGRRRSRRSAYYVATARARLPVSLFQRNFTATRRVRRRRDRRSTTAKSGRSSRRRRSRRRRRRQTDSICWEANVIYVQRQRTCSARRTSRTSRPTFANGWVSLNFPARRSRRRHQLVGGASTVFNTGTGGTTVDAPGHDVQRSAGHRLRGDHVRKRHASSTGGRLLQSNYGGNFNHKTTPLDPVIGSAATLYSGRGAILAPFSSCTSAACGPAPESSDGFAIRSASPARWRCCYRRLV